MTRTADIIYRKTAQGQAELAQRRGELPMRARSVLVMVNGVESASRLVERLGAEAMDMLALLRQRGLIEAIATAERAAAAVSSREVPPARTASAPPAAPTRAPSPPPAPEPAPAAPVDVEAMRRAAQGLVKLLLPFFGPDAPRIAHTSLMAKTGAEFNKGLGEVADRLAIHLGKRKAAEAVAALRQPE